MTLTEWVACLHSDMLFWPMDTAHIYTPRHGERRYIYALNEEIDVILDDVFSSMRVVK